MHHRVPIRHLEGIRECIRHCWPVDTGHHFPQASNHPHWIRYHGQTQVSQKGMPPFASLISLLLFSSWGFFPRPSSIVSASPDTPQASSSVRQLTCTNRSPYSGEPCLPTGVPHTSSTDETQSVSHASRVPASNTHQSGAFPRPY